MCMCDSRCPMSIICCDGQTDILQAEIERKARRWLAAAKASSAAWTRFRFFQAPRTGHRKWRDTSVDMQSAGATAAWGLFILNSYSH